MKRQLWAKKFKCTVYIIEAPTGPQTIAEFVCKLPIVKVRNFKTVMYDFRNIKFNQNNFPHKDVTKCGRTNTAKH
jgi:hypothetical protein